jgi:sugar lactone lactonase YvrE
MRARLLSGFLLASVLASAQQIVTIAGMGPSRRAEIDRKAALDAPLNNVFGLLLSRSGRLILHDEAMVERFEPDGTLLALVGPRNRENSDSSDGVPASVLRLTVLRGMAEDAAGALYLADAAAGRIYRVGPDGTVTTFAGGGSRGFGSESDGGRATDAFLPSPRGLAFDSKGDLLVAEAICHCIRRITPAGILSTVYTLPPSTSFNYFEGLAIDRNDNLLAAEFAGDQVVKIAPDGTATIVAGAGVAGFAGDGGPALSAQLSGPSGVATAGDGSLYIADTRNHRIRRVSPEGIISTVAGTGVPGFSGDGGPALAAQLRSPAQLLFGSDGSLFVTDYGNGRLRRIAPDGTIVTIAGNRTSPGVPPPASPDGGPAVDAAIASASAIIFDDAGNLLVAEGTGNRVRKIAPDGSISTLVGNGVSRYAGDGGPAIDAGVPSPSALAFDSLRALYIAEGDSRVRKVDAGGVISPVAGAGTGSGLDRAQGDGGPATAATLNEPRGVAVDAAGNVYIADTSNARLRVVDRNGVIRTVAGPGRQGVDYWNAVTLDARGNVYIATTHAEPNALWSVVERVNADGSFKRVAGNGQPCSDRPSIGFTYDGQPATAVPLCVIVGLTFDSAGALYIPESRYGAVLRMGPDGLIARVAGTNEATVLGDGGPALDANLGSGGSFVPASIAFDRRGELFIAAGNRIRQVTATPLELRVSRDRIDLVPGGSEPLRIATNFAQSFPYLVRLRTADGGAWLTANRSSGITGEPLTIGADARSLVPGVYRGTVTVRLVAPKPLDLEIPVSLTVR